MDQRERIEDHQEAVRAGILGALKETWTSLPAIVDSFDPATGTVVLQPVPRAQVRKSDGTWVSTLLPPLVRVPVCFPGGGGFTLTFPIAHGDEGIVVFSCRSLDNWFIQGGATDPVEIRSHDLSDGMWIPGLRSLPRALQNISTVSAQLRSDDGRAALSFNPDGSLSIVAPGGLSITSMAGVTVAGNLTVLGQFTNTP